MLFKYSNIFESQLLQKSNFKCDKNVELLMQRHHIRCHNIWHIDTQHNDTQCSCRVSQIIPLCWVSLCWVSLCWVSICWVSLCWVSLCWVSLCLVSLCWVSQWWMANRARSTNKLTHSIMKKNKLLWNGTGYHFPRLIIATHQSVICHYFLLR